jgi:acyl carrier protein
MTSTQTVHDVVRTTLATRLGTEEDQIDLDLPLHLLPNIESVVMLNVIVDVENTLGIVIPDDVPFAAATARDLIKLVEQLL